MKKFPFRPMSDDLWVNFDKGFGDLFEEMSRSIREMNKSVSEMDDLRVKMLKARISKFSYDSSKGTVEYTQDGKAHVVPVANAAEAEQVFDGLFSTEEEES